MTHPASASALFDLTGRVAVITGGAGLLGKDHAAAIASAGGVPVLVDLRADDAERAAADLRARFDVDASGFGCDITQEPAVEALLQRVLERYGRVDILVNNAANNPKQESAGTTEWSRLESFPLRQWEADVAVGLTGSFLCSRVIGAELARRGKGVIVNVASDLGIIAPDQRLYRREGAPPDQQPVKPVTYSVVKTGLIGLTRYLATYWADRGVRVNALSPGGVFNGQPEDFVQRLSQLIPMQRMGRLGELQGAMLFLCSDASSYMTGSNLVIDGGRTCW